MILRRPTLKLPCSLGLRLGLFVQFSVEFLDCCHLLRAPYAAGLGVRYRIAVASFGIDVAQALSESGRNPRFHLYISTQF